MGKAEPWQLSSCAPPSRVEMSEEKRSSAEVFAGSMHAWGACVGGECVDGSMHDWVVCVCGGQAR